MDWAKKLFWQTYSLAIQPHILELSQWNQKLAAAEGSRMIAIGKMI